MIEPLEQRTFFAASAPNDFVYQLQNINIPRMDATRFDLAVIDYSADGSDEMRFSASQIKPLKTKPDGSPRTVLAYMSIGEAEDYRFYWQNSWDANHNGVPDAGAPSWLARENPDWGGNYKVKYWDTRWQALIFKYVDKLVAAGFSGCYLDLVDAFEYWEPGGESGANRAAAARDMVDFIKRIANRARNVDGAKNFQIFAQNGEALGAYADYLSTVNGIGIEDLWYDGNHANDPADSAYRIKQIDRFKQSGKSVLTINYMNRQSLIDDFYKRAKAKGYIAYVSDRELDRLMIVPGHPPD